MGKKQWVVWCRRITGDQLGLWEPVDAVFCDDIDALAYASDLFRGRLDMSVTVLEQGLHPDDRQKKEHGI